MSLQFFEPLSSQRSHIKTKLTVFLIVSKERNNIDKLLTV